MFTLLLEKYVFFNLKWLGWRSGRYTRRLKAVRFSSVCLKFKKIKTTTLIGLALIATGLSIAAISLDSVWLSQRGNVNAPRTNHALYSNQVNPPARPFISGTPVHISIPSLAIDLAVTPGYYNPADQSWTLTNDKAQYGTTTTKANNHQGDTFIYGHALMNIFGKLSKIQPGGQAIITTDNGHVFTYTFANSVITTPQDTSLFRYTGKPILVLQTCTGLWYQDRQLFTFDFTSAT